MAGWGREFARVKFEYAEEWKGGKVDWSGDL